MTVSLSYVTRLLRRVALFILSIRLFFPVSFLLSLLSCSLHPSIPSFSRKSCFLTTTHSLILHILTPETVCAVITNSSLPGLCGYNTNSSLPGLCGYNTNSSLPGLSQHNHIPLTGVGYFLHGYARSSHSCIPSRSMSAAKLRRNGSRVGSILSSRSAGMILLGLLMKHVSSSNPVINEAFAK